MIGWLIGAVVFAIAIFFSIRVRDNQSLFSISALSAVIIIALIPENSLIFWLYVSICAFSVCCGLFLVIQQYRAKIKTYRFVCVGCNFEMDVEAFSIKEGLEKAKIKHSYETQEESGSVVFCSIGDSGIRLAKVQPSQE